MSLYDRMNFELGDMIEVKTCTGNFVGYFLGQGLTKFFNRPYIKVGATQRHMDARGDFRSRKIYAEDILEIHLLKYNEK